MSEENNTDQEMRRDEQSNFIIPIDSIFDDFKEHLDIENNSRILFSGKFGIGKTYFLNRFFEEHKDEYFAIHLHPTSYQISGNEKIIEYIKTDILVSIFEQRNKINESITKLRKKVAESKWCSVAISAGKAIPVIGTVATSMDSIIKEAGTITESHIKRELGKIDKKKVLIIDDLDRLDPEHIFRILNVFSSFVGEGEENTESDKLGFERVICVCDFGNVRNIFSHVYGRKTDFSGYIDKYFSVDVYKYDERARKIISDQLDKMISLFNVSDNEKEFFTEIGKTAYCSYLIYRTLHLCFHSKNNYANLRVLLKAIRYKLPALSDIKGPSRMSKMFNVVDANQLTSINGSIKSLKSIFGEKEVLVDHIKSIIKEYDSTQDNDYSHINSAFCAIFLVLLLEKNLPISVEQPRTTNQMRKVYKINLPEERRF